MQCGISHQFVFVNPSVDGGYLNQHRDHAIRYQRPGVKAECGRSEVPEGVLRVVFSKCQIMKATHSGLSPTNRVWNHLPHVLTQGLSLAWSSILSWTD